MLLSGERTMAIYCPACEQVQFHQFSLFELSSSPQAFYCACGFTQAHITKHNRRYEISLMTAAGDRVRLLFPFREIWSASLLTLYSPDEGEILGFFGDAEHVEEAVADLEKVLEVSDNEVLLNEAEKVLKLIEADRKR